MPNGPLREPFVAVHGARRRTTSGPRTASSAPRPYIGYITSQWHTRQPQSLEQLAAISWCRSHAYRTARILRHELPLFVCAPAKARVRISLTVWWRFLKPPFARRQKRECAHLVHDIVALFEPARGVGAKSKKLQHCHHAETNRIHRGAPELALV